ncbi:SDR family oxidoreductase [Microtetraspora sp. NBRC 16547]|uniref:SDR family oxidoreductase n=1 Tax=Microtetraspora sp. NBRC 16547 TaxID=3030993 RepID=UPI0024A1CFD1|nr:SDR family oxidoreductase [Microtetraspora sp. NBRC 16547]GLX02675.1 hypothetical protein Misp02_67610 [Microtetraspora sp. NBRC 16547]
MLIGLIADTHVPEAAPALPQAVLDVFAGCDRVLRCGDLHALARHISGRWGRRGIRATAVLLGFVVTDKMNADEKMLQTYLALHRSPRLGEPVDIAAMVTLLLSDEGAWINGQTIAVNGGAHLMTG